MTLPPHTPKPDWVADAERRNAERRAKAKADAERLDEGCVFIDEFEDEETGAKSTLLGYSLKRLKKRLAYNTGSRGARRKNKAMGRITKGYRDFDRAKKRIETP